MKRNHQPRQQNHRPQQGRRPEKPLNKPEGPLVVEGLPAILEFARHKPGMLKKIFANSANIAAAQKALAPLKVTEHVVRDREDENERRSPVWAEVSIPEKSVADLEAAKDRLGSTILALDHISDPRNLGAIVRSAAFFGVKTIIVPERRQAPIGRSALQTSAGGFAHVEVYVVTNLGRILEEAKEWGYWIIGTAADGEPLEKLRGEYEKQVIVMGAEDEGMAQGIRKKCDRCVAISGAAVRVESLNVSVAAGIVMQALVRLQL